jgi:predicted RNase H-like nuclease (RuvC/YqgF family)
MTEPNNHAPTDDQNEKIIDSLRYEIASLKSQLKKKDDRIATLDAMLNQVMESHSARVRDYEDIEDKLKDVVEMLRKRISHGDILDFLKVKDSNEFQFRKLW